MPFHEYCVVSVKSASSAPTPKKSNIIPATSGLLRRGSPYGPETLSQTHRPSSTSGISLRRKRFLHTIFESASPTIAGPSPEPIQMHAASTANPPTFFSSGNWSEIYFIAAGSAAARLIPPRKRPRQKIKKLSVKAQIRLDTAAQRMPIWSCVRTPRRSPTQPSSGARTALAIVPAVLIHGA